jgi:hypothetical protein
MATTAEQIAELDGYIKACEQRLTVRKSLGIYLKREIAISEMIIERLRTAAQTEGRGK